MRWLVIVTALALGAAGCASPTPANPYIENGAPDRDEVLAAELVEKAGAVEASNEDQAETHLRAALAADIFCAKAHNNLGVLLLRRGDLYGAATEFEWARKLLPGHPEPRVNLALTLERAGQYGAARDSYEAALEVYPGYIAATQGAARLAVAEGESPVELVRWLAQIAVEGESAEWRDWARRESAKLERHGDRK